MASVAKSKSLVGHPARRLLDHRFAHGDRKAWTLSVEIPGTYASKSGLGSVIG